ncbi:probable disease resistance protein At5g66900 [Corylus avellana]|uniref:probable disease resistance protein At5g66900 n=1 Tax=Corylus avellana TaxID=13451 RepID=UPI00286AA001|nr:probable disease resistance protein At5g66900 [Corylus avellana]
MADAVLGAVLGEAFSQLFETVKDVINKARMFESILTQLQSTLASLVPLVEEIRRLNREVGHPEEEIKSLIKHMKKGTKLVSKCSKISWWNYCMKSQYAGKLSELDEDIGRFFQVDLQAWNARNVLETLARVNAIGENMNLFARNGGMSCAVPGPPEFIVGLDVHMKQLKMLLLNEEVSVLVLTAPAGCGKTTMVKMLCQDMDIKGKFKENIFFFPVSKTPNLKVIVERLFRHKNNQVPADFQNDEDAINQLEQLLKRIEGSILLILDDVWSGSESLIEKFEFHMPNYKILVTSRTAFPRFSFTYKLQPLNDKDAMTLFCHSAALQDGNSSIPDQDIKKILKVCGGFPLALKVIGRSLCGQSAEACHSWVKKWTSGRSSILDSDSDLLICLQKSLDLLDDEVIKKCFLDLGLFPEDQRIPVAALIDMWAELYELDEGGIDAIANLHEITSRNLASLVVTRKVASDVGSYYSEDFVLQHDLLRELAIHQSNQEPIEQTKRLIINITGNNLPKWWTEQKRQPISAHLMSISTDEMFSSSWCNIEPSEVEVLVLNLQTKNYTLPEFVEKMDKLKVLIVTNYGFFHAELGNFQLLESAPYLKKIRLEKVSIPSLCKVPIRLRSLKKISLFMCNIGQAFGNCTIQVSNALPNLMEINMDYCNDLVELPAGLCDIVCLKKLSITNCHKLSALPQGIGKLRNLELLRLRSCTDLWELPESIRSLHELSILDISDCISMTKLPKTIGGLSKLKELHLKGCMRILRSQLPASILDLEQLKLVICDAEGVKLWDPIKELHTGLEIKVAEKDINLNWLPIHDF